MVKIVSIFLLNLYLFANECLLCHKSKELECSKSLHFTLKSAINITREVWGVEESNETLQTIPLPKKNISKPKDLVDDFLRRKCLRCHLKSKIINKSDNICLACHNRHKNRDDSEMAKATQKKCLKCHNREFIGIDYIGLSPHDYDKSYRSPIDKNGNYPKKIGGIDYHHLIEDIHYKKGLTCLNCHKKSKNRNWEREIECKECHKKISKNNHKKYHKNISCSACHSSWNSSSYQLNLLRDDTKNYKQWRRLIVQEDTYLEKFLKKAIRAKNPPPPLMPDFLTNELKSGIWYSGWKFRRWENFFLVKNLNGKIEVARPLFQYRISYKDRNGKMVLNDIFRIDNRKIEAFLPKAPHTITKKAKSCEMCHNNRIMLNKNSMDILKGRVYKGRKLTQEELKRLKSDYYKRERAKTLFK